MKKSWKCRREGGHSVGKARGDIERDWTGEWKQNSRKVYNSLWPRATGISGAEGQLCKHCGGSQEPKGAAGTIVSNDLQAWVLKKGSLLVICFYNTPATNGAEWATAPTHPRLCSSVKGAELQGFPQKATLAVRKLWGGQGNEAQIAGSFQWVPFGISFVLWFITTSTRLKVELSPKLKLSPDGSQLTDKLGGNHAYCCAYHPLVQNHLTSVSTISSLFLLLL